MSFTSASSSRKLICFFLPLLRAMAIPPGHGFHARREEPVDWLADAPWTSEYDGLREILSERNFVAFTFAQQPGTPVFDATALDGARKVADATCKIDRDEPDASSAGYVSLPPETRETVFVRTILVARTVLLRTEGDTLDAAIGSAFDRCLEELQLLESVYVTASGDLNYRASSRPTCYPMCLYSTYDPYDDTWTDLGMFAPNFAEAFMPPNPAMDPSTIDDMTIRWQRLRRGDPFALYVEQAQRANRYQEIDGDYQAAVVQGYTAAEVLLDTILVSMAWEELVYWSDSSLRRSEVVGWFSKRSSLDVRITNQFAGRLKGWDTENRQKPLYWWRENISLLRNRVVHVGYRPTELEAWHCIDTARQLEDYLKNLLSSDANRNKYPRTALMYMGRPGLQRRGKYIGKLKQLDEASQDGDWTGELIEFREWLDTELLRTKGNPM